MRAPHRYSGVAGPGTLVMLQFASARRRPDAERGEAEHLARQRERGRRDVRFDLRQLAHRDGARDGVRRAGLRADEGEPFGRVGDLRAELHLQPRHGGSGVLLGGSALRRFAGRLPSRTTNGASAIRLASGSSPSASR